ncbi:fatty acid-binding protein-like [Culicoides brevitarsis]|uniref:fatty acid-binding protein-like n=1 Tax=Culicoides brevitarsis TaxID=469753 RepID=UPI00307CB117
MLLNLLLICSVVATAFAQEFLYPPENVPIWKGKRYELRKAEKLDEFLTEIGINFFKRKFFLLQEPIIELIDIGNDEYIMRHTTTLKTTEFRFKPDVEFQSDQISQLEGTYKAKVTFDTANRLTLTYLDGPQIQIVYDFKETQLQVTSSCNNVEARRWFKAI